LTTRADWYRRSRRRSRELVVVTDVIAAVSVEFIVAVDVTVL